MPGPLSKGQQIATLDRAWPRGDQHVEIRSDGVPHDTLEAAEDLARTRATRRDVDTVVIRDKDNRFWVYDVDELTKLGGDNNLDGDVRGQIADLRLPKGVTVQRFMASRSESAKDVQTILMGRWDSVDANEIASPLSDFPDYRKRLTATIKSAATMLTNAKHQAKRGGQTTDAISRAIKELEDGHRALEKQDYRDAAQHIARLDAMLAQALDAGASGYGRDVLLRVQRTVSSRVSPPGRLSSAPAAVTEQAKVLFSSYKDQTELAINAVYAEGFSEVLDWPGLTRRIRPHDAASALLRLNTCIWTVVRDVRHGRVEPGAFGKADWAGVTPRDMYDLALERLKAGTIDFDNATPAMLADPLWKDSPVQIRDPEEGLTELKPENISRVWKRSLDSAFLPDAAAKTIEAMGFAQQMRDASVTIAGAPADKRQAVADAGLVTSAYGLFKGKDLPPNSSQALLAITTAAHVPVVIPQICEPGATSEELTKRVEKGEIAAFARAGPGFIVFKHRTIPEIAAQVRRKIDSHELDHLGTRALKQLREMTGPGTEPGALLQQRLKSEGSSRYWRALASEVAVVAAIGLASGGVGALVEGTGIAVAGLWSAATVSRGTIATIRAARFVATSVSFTTLSGLVEGKIDPARYPIDMVMFYCLGQAGRFAQFLSSSGPTARLPGYVQKALGHGMAVGSSAGTLTVFSAGEKALRGHSPTWDESWQQLGRNLILVSVLHGVNMGIARLAPEIGPDAQLRRVAQQYQARARQAASELSARLDDLSTCLTEAASLPSDSPRLAELTARAETLIAQIDAQRVTVTDLADSFTKLVRATAPRSVADKALKELDEVRDVEKRAGVERQRGASWTNVPLTLETDKVPPHVFEHQRMSAPEKTRTDGVMGLASLPLAPEISRSTAIDTEVLLRRVLRMDARIAELESAAKSGDRGAQEVLERLQRVRAAQDEARAQNSTTINGEYIGHAGRTTAGARRSALNYDNAVALIEQWAADARPATAEAIKDRLSLLNETLTEEVEIWNGRRGTDGEYRSAGMDVWAGDRKYLPGSKVQEAMDSFCGWYVQAEQRVAAGNMTSVELAARAYQMLVSIHPFVDANGRTTRLFMDWVLLRHGLPRPTNSREEIMVAHFLEQYGNRVPARDNKVADDAVLSILRGLKRSISEQAAVVFPGNATSPYPSVARRP